MGSGGSGSGGAVMGSGGNGSGGTPVVDAAVDTGPKDAGTKDTDNGTDAVANGPATFTELWNTIFSIAEKDSTSSCSGSSCHNPSTQDGVTMSSKMSAYTSLKAKVSTANPDSSALMTRIADTKNDGRRMPPTGMNTLKMTRTPLSAALIARVRSWIMNGA
jgi:hypothetical protein